MTYDKHTVRMLLQFVHDEAVADCMAQIAKAGRLDLAEMLNSGHDDGKYDTEDVEGVVSSALIRRKFNSPDSKMIRAKRAAGASGAVRGAITIGAGIVSEDARRNAENIRRVLDGAEATK